MSGWTLAEMDSRPTSDLTVDPDGCPVLHVSPATAEQVTAREDEARRVGGPVAP